ncbi:MAG TPA: cyclophilin-like fold protein [Microbacterium sp.]|uniref:cyclophilin-like fold protein n=1 Tax=Microbacterium sp. TaxID=51671 RepID=UPI002F944A87
MPQRSLLRRAPQRVLNSVVTALLLLTVPVLAHGDEAPPTCVVAAFEDSATAAQLVSHLPSTLTFSDRMGAAVFAPLPVPLALDSTAAVDGYRRGDIAYVSSEQSIVVFLTDGTAVPDHGLVVLGHLTSGLQDLDGCVQNCAVELVVGQIGA